MRQKQFTSKEVSIKLHKLYFCKPSKYYYEWTGAIEIEELTRPGWLVDSINVYTENQMKRELPSDVAVNENVVEFGILSTDNYATKIAKVLAYLIENGILRSKHLVRVYR